MGSVETHCVMCIAVWLTISSIGRLSVWRTASESSVESQDQEEVANSTSELSALEQVQERVADSASESSALPG